MSLANDGWFSDSCFICHRRIPAASTTQRKSRKNDLCNNDLLSLFFEVLCDEREEEEDYPKNLAHFCFTCGNFLREWATVKEQLSILQRRADQIKCSISAILLSSAEARSEIDGHQSESSIHAIRVKKRVHEAARKLRNQFDVKVVLENLPTVTTSQVSLPAAVDSQNEVDELPKFEEKTFELGEDFGTDENIIIFSVEDLKLLTEPSLLLNPAEVIPAHCPTNEACPESVGETAEQIENEVYDTADAINLRPRVTLKSVCQGPGSVSDNEFGSANEDGGEHGDDWAPDTSDSETKDISQHSAAKLKSNSGEKKRGKKRPPPKNSVRSIGPNEFLYKKTFNFTVINDCFRCGSCDERRWSEKHMLSHIRDVHLDNRKRRRCYEELGPNEFLYRGKYPFRFIDGAELYACGLCDFTQSRIRRIFSHMKTFHFSQEEKQLYPCVQVGENEYLYAEKYPIYFKDLMYSCGLCDVSRSERYTLYPHIRECHFPPNLQPSGGPTDRMCTANNLENTSGGQDACDAGSQGLTTVPATTTDEIITEENFDQADVVEIQPSKSPNDSEHAEQLPPGWTEESNGRYVHGSFAVEAVGSRFQCLTCSLARKSRKLIFRHVSSVHAHPGEKKRKPKLVDVNFEYRNIPFSFDPAQNKFMCSICPSVGYATKFPLIRHLRKYHLGELPASDKHVCEICGAELSSSYTLDVHRRRHSGKKFQCSKCDKSFTARDYLVQHSKVHLGEDGKKHQCEFCGRKFLTVKQFRNHVTVHTKEKPFPCDLCGEKFANMCKRREHRKKVHGGLPTLSSQHLASRVKTGLIGVVENHVNTPAVLEIL